MRISIRHATHYTYDAVGSFAVQRLRLTPSDNQSQKVLSWAIEAEGIEDAATYVDGFGNRVHLITPQQALRDADASPRRARWRPSIATAWSAISARWPIRASSCGRRRARESSAGDRRARRRGCATSGTLDRLHHLLEAIATRVVYDTDATHSETSAADAFAAGQGVCQDHAHIFIAAARRLGDPGPLRDRLPARRRRGDAPSPTTPGRRPMSTISAGSASIRPTTSARRSAMCASPAASTPPPPRRSPARGAAAGPKSLRVDVIVRQQQQ